MGLPAVPVDSRQRACGDDGEVEVWRFVGAWRLVVGASKL